MVRPDRLRLFRGDDRQAVLPRDERGDLADAHARHVRAVVPDPADRRFRARRLCGPCGPQGVAAAVDRADDGRHAADRADADLRIDRHPRAARDHAVAADAGLFRRRRIRELDRLPRRARPAAARLHVELAVREPGPRDAARVGVRCLADVDAHDRPARKLGLARTVPVRPRDRPDRALHSPLRRRRRRVQDAGALRSAGARTVRGPEDARAAVDRRARDLDRDQLHGAVHADVCDQAARAAGVDRLRGNACDRFRADARHAARRSPVRSHRAHSRDGGRGRADARHRVADVRMAHASRVVRDDDRRADLDRPAEGDVLRRAAGADGRAVPVADPRDRSRGQLQHGRHAVRRLRAVHDHVADQRDRQPVVAGVVSDGLRGVESRRAAGCAPGSGCADDANDAAARVERGPSRHRRRAGRAPFTAPDSAAVRAARRSRQGSRRTASRRCCRCSPSVARATSRRPGCCARTAGC